MKRWLRRGQWKLQRRDNFCTGPRKQADNIWTENRVGRKEKQGIPERSPEKKQSSSEKYGLFYRI